MNKIVLGIIVLNVLVSWKGFGDRHFFDRYKFQVGPILQGEKFRMFSSGFLHADWIHLFFNMYALYLFSENVIYNLNIWNFLLIYVGSLFVGSMLSLYYHKHDYYYSAIGASGAVSGVLYSAILLSPEMKLLIFPLPIPLPAYVFGILYLLYTIYGMKKQLGNIGHDAHLGGAVTGFVLTLMMQPSLFITEKWLVIGLALPLIILFIFEKKIR
ncbi:rhomboid family intramembrane serine protease [Aureivirga marina]|uniref:rhomboid family intramembrane serine protease n=1 Tax=Aureivirga marina TaxID=1182451 RepID=UPI0018C95BD4|nr:rhomboid family intramembrane serine protease [Aureivirga marina]